MQAHEKIIRKICTTKKRLHTMCTTMSELVCQISEDIKLFLELFFIEKGEKNVF